MHQTEQFWSESLQMGLCTETHVEISVKQEFIVKCDFGLMEFLLNMSCKLSIALDPITYEFIYRSLRVYSLLEPVPAPVGDTAVKELCLPGVHHHARSLRLVQ